jgi:hypothetical protein
VDVVVDNEVVDHAHAVRFHRMLSFSCKKNQSQTRRGRQNTCVLIVANIVVVEIAHPLPSHPLNDNSKTNAEQEGVGECCVALGVE